MDENIHTSWRNTASLIMFNGTYRAAAQAIHIHPIVSVWAILNHVIWLWLETIIKVT